MINNWILVADAVTSQNKLASAAAYFEIRNTDLEFQRAWRYASFWCAVRVAHLMPAIQAQQIRTFIACNALPEKAEFRHLFDAAVKAAELTIANDERSSVRAAAYAAVSAFESQPVLAIIKTVGHVIRAIGCEAALAVSDAVPEPLFTSVHAPCVPSWQHANAARHVAEHAYRVQLGEKLKRMADAGAWVGWV